ncbi:MAG: hypothetical protein ACHQAQ_09610 [Hyphomicrobiales bacterium]
MKKRLHAIKRIQTVQEQLRQLAEAKLAELERREAGLLAQRRELVGALNEDTVLHGLFIEAMAKRVRSISSDIAQLEDVKAAQAKRLLEQTGRLKRVDRAAASLDRDYQAALEKSELAELIDSFKPPGA